MTGKLDQIPCLSPGDMFPEEEKKKKKSEWISSSQLNASF